MINARTGPRGASTAGTLAGRARRVLALLLVVSGAPLAQDNVDWLHLDGYEGSGALAMRFSDLDLRDPHVFIAIPNPIGGGTICRDFTDQAIIPGVVNFSFNGQIQTAYTSDTNPADGFLDSSDLLLFRPLAQDGTPQRVETQSGQCSAPVAGTTCAPSPASTPAPFYYASSATGTCLAPLAGTIGSPAYTPAIASATAPCFVTAARTISFNSGGTVIPLIGARIAGTWQGTPATGITNGLLRGFLRQADADLITIPNPTGGAPIVLSSLLPGGTGNCSMRDDRDTVDGEQGWWFYLNFSAAIVPYTGP